MYVRTFRPNRTIGLSATALYRFTVCRLDPFISSHVLPSQFVNAVLVSRLFLNRHRLRAIVFTSGDDYPGHTYQLVRQGDRRFVVASPLLDLIGPLTQRVTLVH